MSSPVHTVIEVDEFGAITAFRFAGQAELEEKALCSEIDSKLKSVPFSEEINLDAFKFPIKSGAIKMLIKLGNICTNPAMSLWFWKQAGIDPVLLVQAARRKLGAALDSTEVSDA